MAAAHAQVTNCQGVPITGYVFDQVIAALVSTLQAEVVPMRTLEMLAAAVAPFREVIVVEE
jgi:hypothetical protein